MPALLADKLERGTVLETSPAAFALGVRSGMTLTQALACVREADVLIDDRARVRTLWERALDALDAASPLVEDAHEGTAFLEMRGIEGTPARWIAAVRTALADFPLALRLGCAANKFAARAAALVADGHVAPAGAERALLAPLPLRILGIPYKIEEQLALLGVRTCGELAALPHGPFVRRFGPAAARWHAHASGSDRTPIVPRPRALQIDRTLYGEGTAEREEHLLFALRTLVARVAEDVALAGKRCGRLILTIECEDGEVRAIPCTFVQPTAQPAVLFDLMRARLEGVRLRSPVTGLRLGAQALEEGGRPLSLFPSSDPDPEALQVMIARLDAALGDGAAQRVRAQPGYRFETRSISATFAHQAGPARCEPPPSFPQQATLQLRRIDAQPVAVEVRRGAPAQVGTPPKTVLDYAGPWRIDECWWAAGSARDDYDVLLEDGVLYRLSRSPAGWAITGCYD